MAPDLRQVCEATWQTLTDAARDAEHPLRYLTLCTMDGNAPAARTLVLRNVLPEQQILVFHTDARSPKWTQLVANPARRYWDTIR